MLMELVKWLRYVPSGQKLPIAAAVGSSNYGIRSARRDLECQLIVVTSNQRLRKVSISPKALSCSSPAES